MSLWNWIRGRLGAGPPPETTPPEGAPEVHSGRPEDAGGVADPDAPDAHSTTGTTPSGTFVGRGSGDDVGYLETGAEKRAGDEGEEPDEPR